MSNFIQQFRDAMAARGIVPPVEIIADGKLHRCAVEGAHGEGDGAYVLHSDGVPAGGFTNWRDGLGWHKWSAAPDRNMTTVERTAYRLKTEATRLHREAEQAQRQASARARAMAIWEKSLSCGTHAYLTRKGIQAHGVRVFHGKLVVPIRDGLGTLQSLQFIDAEGSKKYLAGGKKQGCYFLIGEPNGVLCIAEGFATAASIHEATGYAVAVAFDAGSLMGVAKTLREVYPDLELRLCADDDYQTNGNPGRAKATEAAHAVSGSLAFPDFGPCRPDGATDFNDLRDHVLIKAAVEKARYLSPPRASDETAFVPLAPTESITQAASRLAALPSLEYEKVRENEAKALGIRVTALDKEISRLRTNVKQIADAPFDDVMPWPEPVDAAGLLSEIALTIRRFVVCDPETVHAATLIVVMTWFIDDIKVAPLAVITAPEMACGKSRLLEVMSKLVQRPLAASNITPAAMFRSIDAWQPTLLIDETDTFLKENEELRGILNAGHTKATAHVIRVVGDDFTPTKFSVWGAKVLCGIGKLPDTIMSRAVPLVMRRKLPNEKIEPLRHAEDGLFETLVAKLAKFARDSASAVRLARPMLPVELSDRAQDNWEPLFAIAGVAGGPWPEYARAAAMKLSSAREQPVSIGVELLSDIQDILDRKKVDRISSAELINALCEDDEKRWATFNSGRPITPAQLAKRLNEFKIASGTRRFGLKTAKGYLLSDFEDAFARYIPPIEESVLEGVTASQDSRYEAVAVTVSGDVTALGVTPSYTVTGEPSVGEDCDGVTAQREDGGDEEIEVTL